MPSPSGQQDNNINEAAKPSRMRLVRTSIKPDTDQVGLRAYNQYIFPSHADAVAIDFIGSTTMMGMFGPPSYARSVSHQ